MNELFEKLAAEINQLESWKEITTSDKHPFCAGETETVSRSKVLRILRNGLKEYEEKLKAIKNNEQKCLNISGHEFYPGDLIDYISWKLTDDITDESNSAILRHITDKGIIIFDIDA